MNRFEHGKLSLTWSDIVIDYHATPIISFIDENESEEEYTPEIDRLDPLRIRHASINIREYKSKVSYRETK